jgi:hypothetical protein
MDLCRNEDWLPSAKQDCNSYLAKGIAFLRMNYSKTHGNIPYSYCSSTIPKTTDWLLCMPPQLTVAEVLHLEGRRFILLGTAEFRLCISDSEVPKGPQLIGSPKWRHVLEIFKILSSSLPYTRMFIFVCSP